MYELKFVRILYVLHLYLLSLIVYSMCFTYMFLNVIIFALVLHLDLLEHDGGLF